MVDRWASGWRPARPNAWTPAEDDCLRRHAGAEPVWRLATRLADLSLRDRTLYAIRARTARLGLDAWVRSVHSETSLSRTLGTGHKLVSWWIHAGELEAERGGRGGAKTTLYTIRDGAVRSLIRTHPFMFAAERVKHDGWRALVEIEQRTARRLPVLVAARRYGVPAVGMYRAISLGELAPIGAEQLGPKRRRMLLDRRQVEGWVMARGARSRRAPNGRILPRVLAS